MSLLDGLTQELENPMYNNEVDFRLALESDFDAALEKATEKKMKGLSDADIAFILDDTKWEDDEIDAGDEDQATTTKPGADDFVPGENAVDDDEDDALESLLNSLTDDRSEEDIIMECDALIKEAELSNDSEPKGAGDGENPKVCPYCGKNPCVCLEEKKKNKDLVTVDEPGNNAVVMGDQEGQDECTTSQAKGDDDSDALEALLKALEGDVNDPVRHSEDDGNDGVVDPEGSDKSSDDKAQVKVSEKEKDNSESEDNLDSTETDDMFTHDVEDQYDPKKDKSEDALESLLAALEGEVNEPVRKSEDDGNDGTVDPDAGDKKQDDKDQTKVSEKEKDNSDSEDNLDGTKTDDMFTHDVEEESCPKTAEKQDDALESLLAALEGDVNDPVRHSQDDGNPGVVDPEASDKSADDKAQIKVSEKDKDNSDGDDNLDSTETDDMFTHDVEDQSDESKDKSDNALENLMNIALQNI